MPTYNWLYFHTPHNEHGSTLNREVGTLFRCDANTPLKLFVKKDFCSWNQIIRGPQIFSDFLYSSYVASKIIELFEYTNAYWVSAKTTCYLL